MPTVDPTDPEILAQIQAYLNGVDPSLLRLDGGSVTKPVVHVVHRGRIDGFDFLASGLQVEIQGSGSMARGFVVKADGTLGDLIKVSNGTPVFWTMDKDNVWFIHNSMAGNPSATPTDGPYFYARADHLRLKDSAGLVWRIPDGNLDARINGLECWTYDVINAASEAELVHGTVYLTKVYYPTEGTIDELAFIRAQNLGGGTITDFRAALYSLSGTLLTVSANFSASMGTSGLKLVPVTPYAGTPNYYYVALLSVGSGAGPLVAVNGVLGSVANSNLTAGGLGLRFATDGTTASAMPSSITISGTTSTNKIVWTGINQ